MEDHLDPNDIIDSDAEDPNPTEVTNEDDPSFVEPSEQAIPLEEEE